MLKSLIKSTLKAACVAAAPLCSKKSTMDEQTARSVLEAASARPGGTALRKNTILPPTCDLQIVILCVAGGGVEGSWQLCVADVQCAKASLV